MKTNHKDENQTKKPVDSLLISHKNISRHRPHNSYGKCFLSDLAQSAQRSLSRPANTQSRKKITRNPSPHFPLLEKFSFCSISGHNSHSPCKPNQDSYILSPALPLETCLFSIADGHGPHGQQVSSYIKSRYESLLQSSPFFSTDLKKSIFLSLQKLSTEINTQSFDTSISGSTFISVVFRAHTLFCANIGDSRAILGRREHDWKVIPLSRDHKVDIPEEAFRIKAKGGRVAPLQDCFGKLIGPARVWLKDRNFPGLAMSRSLGDKIAASVGVSAEPEICQVGVKENDKFVVVASDGVFEVLSNEDVLRVVAGQWEKGDVDKAADQVARMARAAWCKIGDKVDDISCIVVFLNAV